MLGYLSAWLVYFRQKNVYSDEWQKNSVRADKHPHFIIGVTVLPGIGSDKVGPCRTICVMGYRSSARFRHWPSKPWLKVWHYEKPVNTLWLMYKNIIIFLWYGASDLWQNFGLQHVLIQPCTSMSLGIMCFFSLSVFRFF